MITVGASTANFYPDLTENALETVLSLGCPVTEVFVNTASETTPTFCRMLAAKAEDYGARIVSYHPYTSYTEPHVLFSPYVRRYEDGLEQYRVQFAAAAEMGASFLVLHGDRYDGIISMDESVERYGALYEVGQQQGVTLLQENVVRYRSQHLEYLRELRRQLGDKARFVFDLKQAVRSGLSFDEVLDAMGDGLAHVHISDHDGEHDCLTPGKGTVDFVALFSRLRKSGFDGCVMMELYRRNFEDAAELGEGFQTLLKALASSEHGR